MCLVYLNQSINLYPLCNLKFNMTLFILIQELSQFKDDTTSLNTVQKPKIIKKACKMKKNYIKNIIAGYFNYI